MDTIYSIYRNKTTISARRSEKIPFDISDSMQSIIKSAQNDNNFCLRSLQNQHIEIIADIESNTAERCKAALYKLNELVLAAKHIHPEDQCDMNAYRGLLLFVIGAIHICGNSDYPVKDRRQWARDAFLDASEDASEIIRIQAKECMDALNNGTTLMEVQNRFFPCYPQELTELLHENGFHFV